MHLNAHSAVKSRRICLHGFLGCAFKNFVVSFVSESNRANVAVLKDDGGVGLNASFSGDRVVGQSPTRKNGLLLRRMPRYSPWRNYKWGLANPSLVPHALAVVLCNRLVGADALSAGGPINRVGPASF